MATTPTAGANDPSVLRQIERQNTALTTRPQLAAAPSVPGSSSTPTGNVNNNLRALAPIVSGADTLYPLSTTTTTSNGIIINSTVNNDSGDITTVYSTNGTVSATAINQTVNQYTAVDSGVSQILAGGGVTISSTGESGKGVVTITAAAGNVGNIATLNLDGNAANVLHGDGTWSADVTTYSNSNVVSLMAAFGSNTITTTGNATVGNLIGPHANGNSSVNMPAANGNINLTAVGNTTMIITGTGANITGTANISGNANVGNLGAAQILATANVTAPQLISNIATGTAPLVITSTTQVANLSVATAGTATTAGTVTTAAQPNITSVGTLTSLAVTGNANVGNLNATTAVIASTLTSNVATGTAPLTITSTTRVANLNVDYANVADFINVTAPGTGTGYLVFANATTGNIAEYTSSGISANLANNAISATTFVGALANGNSNVNIATANGNVTIAAVGNTTMTVTGTGANITGTLNVTGNITGNTAGFAIGYLNIPQVAASNTTLALTDAGKHYYSTSTGNFTLTVPNNTSASFATGTAISIVVQSTGNVLVNAASGVTLYMAGNSTAANRVVSNYGMATLLKVATDTWMINGTGVA